MIAWIISLSMSLKPNSWSSLQREILSQMLLLLSAISPLNVCLLQNFLASFSLTNCLGIFYVDHVCKKARKISGFIHRSFHSAQIINTHRTLYLALVRPILKYASTTWYPLNIKLTNKIESTQRFACRVILQQWNFSHDELLQDLWPTNSC